jgi:hypothetical protein
MHKKEYKVFIVLAADADLKYVAVVVMELRAHIA